MSENSEGVSRRKVMLGAAWSVPVIAAAIAVPQAAASVPSAATPAACIRLTKHQWQGVFSDGTTTEIMDNGTAMSSPVWGDLCRDAKHDK